MPGLTFDMYLLSFASLFVCTISSSPRGRLNGGAMISTPPNERALLGCLLAKLAALDADVIVGHNIGAYELAVLMGRLQTHKVRVLQ